MASTASTAGSSAGGGGGASSQNKWDYELSPSSTDTTTKSEQHSGHGLGGQHGHGGHGHGLHHHHHHVHGGSGGGGGGNRGEPDILQLPMGLPPPPGTSAISEECELCLTSSSSSPPPPPLEAPAGFSPANNGGHGMRLQPFMKQPPLAFLGTSRTLPRRISREGLLNEPEVTEIDLDDSMHQLSRAGGGLEGSGSTDPLLQIPTQLSAVLTLKRHTQAGQHAKPTDSSSSNNLLTPLLKRKRESIV